MAGRSNCKESAVKSFNDWERLKYDKWVSAEVFDFSPEGKLIAEESMKSIIEIE
jgi:hypothetical protein